MTEEYIKVKEFKHSILNTYFFDMKNLARQEYEYEKEQIIKKDEIQKILINAQTKLEKIFKEEGRNLYRYISFDKELMTEGTKEKLRKAEEEYNEKIEHHNLTLKEVDGILELTDTYEQKLEILKKYDILDEEGNYYL